MVLAVLNLPNHFSRKTFQVFLFLINTVIFCKQLKLHGMGHILLICSTILKILSGMSYHSATGIYFFHSNKGQIVKAFKQVNLKIGCLLRFFKYI